MTTRTSRWLNISQNINHNSLLILGSIIKQRKLTAALIKRRKVFLDKQDRRSLCCKIKILVKISCLTFMKIGNKWLVKNGLAEVRKREVVRIQNLMKIPLIAQNPLNLRMMIKMSMVVVVNSKRERIWNQKETLLVWLNLKIFNNRMSFLNYYKGISKHKSSS